MTSELLAGRLLTVIGQAYNNLGAFDKARAVLDEAHAAWTKELRPDDPALGELHTSLGWNHFWLARYDAARASFGQATFGGDHFVTAFPLRELGGLGARRVRRPRSLIRAA